MHDARFVTMFGLSPLFGAADDDDDDDAGQEPAGSKKAKAKDDKPKTFSQDYVDELRSEAAGNRVKAKENADELKKLQAKVTDIEKGEMDDLERAKSELEEAAVKMAELETETVSARAEAKTLKVEHAVMLAAIGADFRDPADALSMISQDDLIDEEGKLSNKKITARLTAIAEAKPYLIKPTGTGSGDGAPKGTPPMDDESFTARVERHRKEMIESGDRIAR